MDKTRNTGSSRLLTAMGAGALLMYLFDPQHRRRRMAVARDRIAHLAGCAAHELDVAGRDLANRSAGLLAELRGSLHRTPVSDEVLVQRVRTALGRLSAHPRAIGVTASEGRVMLDGLALRDEMPRVLHGVRGVRGVQELSHRIEACDSAAHISSLQGGRSGAGPRARLLHANRAPGPRLLAFGAGCGLALYGFARRGPAGLLAGIAGAAVASSLLVHGRRGRPAHVRENAARGPWASNPRDSRTPQDRLMAPEARAATESIEALGAPADAGATGSPMH